MANVQEIEAQLEQLMNTYNDLTTELRKLHEKAADTIHLARSWCVIAEKQYGVRLERPPCQLVVDANLMNAAELMRQYMRSFRDQAPFRPIEVRDGIEREYGRRLRDNTIVSTRRRHPDQFRVVGPRGLFDLTEFEHVHGHQLAVLRHAERTEVET